MLSTLTTATMTGSAELFKLKTINYEYDALGRRTKLVYPDDTNVTYEYDSMSRLTNIRYEGSIIAEYGYDELSRRTLLQYGNDANIVYQYDLGDRLTRIANNTASGPIDFQYTDYDNIGNRKNMLVDNNESVYKYDKLYQLVFADYPAAWNVADVNYYYDSLGNRTSVYNGSTTSYLHNSLNQYYSVAAAAFSYDSNSNLTNDGVFRYYYDCENRLIDVNDQSDSPVAHYEYDYLGRRISKTDYTLSPARYTLFCYDGDQVIAEYSGGGTLLRKFVYGPGIDEPIMMIDASSGSRYYYHYDGLGSVAALSNNIGEVVERYRYDAF
ncbi:MAG: hypothetical protein PHP01_08895, partial [Phycisphaerae bacterium]|nr:hypothetical protein [Phycisphaerae bacterium]